MPFLTPPPPLQSPGFVLARTSAECLFSISQTHALCTVYVFLPGTVMPCVQFTTSSYLALSCPVYSLRLPTWHRHALCTVYNVFLPGTVMPCVQFTMSSYLAPSCPVYSLQRLPTWHRRCLQFHLQSLSQCLHCTAHCQLWWKRRPRSYHQPARCCPGSSREAYQRISSKNANTP